MKNWIFPGLFLLSVCRYFFFGQVDFWWSKWSLILVLCSGVIACKINKKFHLLLALSFFWVMLSGIYHFSWFDNPYALLSAQTQASLKAHGAHGTICFLLICVTVLMLIKYHKIVFNSLWVLCLMNSLYVIFQWLSGNHFLERGGFYGNGSINGCIIGFTFPLILMAPIKNKVVMAGLLAIPVVSIFASQTSVPVGTILAGVCVLAFFKARTLKWKAILTGSVIIGFLGTGWAVSQFVCENVGSRKFFYTSHRVKINVVMLQELFKSGEYLIGQGPGTYNVFGPIIQIRHKLAHIREQKVISGFDAKGPLYKKKYTKGLLIFSHSDWCQTIFEVGIIGFILSFLAAFLAIIRGIKRKEYEVLACFTAFLAAAFCNFPFHYPTHAFCGIFFIAFLLRRE